MNKSVLTCTLITFLLAACAHQKPQETSSTPNDQTERNIAEVKPYGTVLYTECATLEKPGGISTAVVKVKMVCMARIVGTAKTAVTLTLNDGSPIQVWLITGSSQNSP